mgnify:CR=1 FL=1
MITTECPVHWRADAAHGVADWEAGASHQGHQQQPLCLLHRQLSEAAEHDGDNSTEHVLKRDKVQDSNWRLINNDIHLPKLRSKCSIPVGRLAKPSWNKYQLWIGHLNININQLFEKIQILKIKATKLWYFTSGDAVNEPVSKVKKMRGPPVAAPSHAWKIQMNYEIVDFGKQKTEND